MIIFRKKLFGETENLQVILDKMKAAGKGPGDPKFDKLSQNLTNRQTINNSVLPKNQVVSNTNLPAVVNKPQTPMTLTTPKPTVPNVPKTGGLGKFGKGAAIVGGLAAAGLMANSLFGGKKDN
jgi:hypothetical protein